MTDPGRMVLRAGIEVPVPVGDKAKEIHAECDTPYDLAVKLGIEGLQQPTHTRNPKTPRKSPDRECGTDSMHAARRDCIAAC